MPGVFCLKPRDEKLAAGYWADARREWIVGPILTKSPVIKSSKMHRVGEYGLSSRRRFKARVGLCHIRGLT
jgi:hypothetical protein